MIKKKLILLISAFLIAGNSYALPEVKFGLGAGAYFTSDFGGGIDASVDYLNLYVKTQTPYVGGGGYLFFDGTFVEMSFGVGSIGGTWKSRSSGFLTQNLELNMTGAIFDINLFGKYPFLLSDKLTVFPMFGITYRNVIIIKYNNVQPPDLDAANYSALWFELGGGAAYYLNEKIYFQAGILYGLRVRNKYEKDAIDVAGSGNIETYQGHGLDVKLAVGYLL